MRRWEQPIQDNRLINAIKSRDTKLALGLIEIGVGLNARDDIMRATPLMLASAYGLTEVVDHLLNLNVDVNEVAKRAVWNGYTALIYACENGNVHIASKLLEAGAKINAAADFGVTALTFACQKGHLEVVKFLLKNNAMIQKKDINLAEQDNHPEIAALLREAQEAIKSGKGFARRF